MKIKLEKGGVLLEGNHTLTISTTSKKFYKKSTHQLFT
jgi:hypothetical protein